MVLVKAGVGAILGAAIGMAIWIAIGYYTGYEVGYVAWGIGALAGFGAMAAARDEASAVTGGLAAVVAVLAILVAKYAVVYAALERDLPEMQKAAAMTITDDQVRSTIAREVIEERTASGKKVTWPAGVNSEEAEWPSEYPKTVVAETNKRWGAMKPEQQQAKKAELQQQYDQSMTAFTTELMPTIRNAAFEESFGLFDLLWIGLALASAYKLGSGGGDD